MVVRTDLDDGETTSNSNPFKRDLPAGFVLQLVQREELNISGKDEENRQGKCRQPVMLVFRQPALKKFPNAMKKIYDFEGKRN